MILRFLLSENSIFIGETDFKFKNKNWSITESTYIIWTWNFRGYLYFEVTNDYKSSFLGFRGRRIRFWYWFQVQKLDFFRNFEKFRKFFSQNQLKFFKKNVFPLNRLWRFWFWILWERKRYTFYEKTTFLLIWPWKTIEIAHFTLIYLWLVPCWLDPAVIRGMNHTRLITAGNLPITLCIIWLTTSRQLKAYKK